MNEDVRGTGIHPDASASSPDWPARSVLLRSSQIESCYIAMHPVVGNLHSLQVPVVIRVHTRRVRDSHAGVIAVVVIKSAAGRIHVDVYSLISEDGIVVSVNAGAIKRSYSVEHAVSNDVVRDFGICAQCDGSSSVGIFDLAVE